VAFDPLAPIAVLGVGVVLLIRMAVEIAIVGISRASRIVPTMRTIR
jgi:hypothetical protein